MKAISAAVLVAASLTCFLAGCPADVTGEGEGEGEGDAAEGEGDAGEGEGDAGEGEGDAGEGEGEGDACPIAPACPAAPVSTLAFTATGAGEPGVAVDNGALLSVGTSTRSDVVAELGAGAADPDNAFRVFYCDAGIVVQYVDGDGTFDDASAAGTGADVLARVLTLPDATFTPPSISADGTYAGDAGTVLFDSGKGVELVEDATDAVVGAVLFKRQPADNWGLALNLTPDSETLGTLTLGTSRFSDATTLLGDAFDTEGQASVSSGFGSVDVKVRIYASLGLRLAGVCGSSGCDETVRVQSITISPPFFGTDNGLGVGTSKTDLENALSLTGAAPDQNGVTVYGDTGLGHKPLGVFFVQDAQCVERAAAYVMGYTPP